MAIWVLDPEAVLAFRQRHRRQVVRSRFAKRKQREQEPRDRKQYDDIDRQWLRAIELDRS